MKIEIKKEIGIKGRTFYCVYLDGNYNSSYLDVLEALNAAGNIEDYFLNPVPKEIIYSKELTKS